MTKRIDPEWAEAIDRIKAGPPLSDAQWITAVCETVKEFPTPAAHHPTSTIGKLLCLVVDRSTRVPVQAAGTQTADAKGEVLDAVPVV